MDASTHDMSVEDNCVNLPTAVLSDVDDISDVEIEDVADELHKTMSARPVYKEQRSIFNTTLDLTEGRPAGQQADVAVAAYKEYVAREKLNWESFITSRMPKPGALRATSASFKPSQEQQTYLSQGPNIQSFIRCSSAFMNDSSSFLLEFEQMQHLQEDLRDCCEFHVHNIQRNKVAKSLARN